MRVKERERKNNILLPNAFSSFVSNILIVVVNIVYSLNQKHIYIYNTIGEKIISKSIHIKTTVSTHKFSSPPKKTEYWMYSRLASFSLNLGNH